MESGLLKMPAGGERLGDVTLVHNRKRDAVRQRPVFVGTFRKERNACLKIAR